ncbi:hypothetical protein BN14_09952 [Rhizoctonia solani AG-1 IB]|uniref:Uncharacterized protein n=1 Tax=Thanatephorus cucumeris (strain AG1-IB / isolate 7/3/14) TaxID=1108050 RepID=M5CGB6_THACB|nr:hypothetical protein BN14_09952 [Rhizoctonia solani AG-1 IB]
MLPSTLLRLLNVLIVMFTFSTLAYAFPTQPTLEDDLAALIKCRDNAAMSRGLGHAAKASALVKALQAKIQPGLQELANQLANGDDPSSNIALITASMQEATSKINQLSLSPAAPATAEENIDLINDMANITTTCSVGSYQYAPVLDGVQPVNK